MPPQKSRKSNGILVIRHRYLACTIAPWILQYLLCSVFASPTSPFRLFWGTLYSTTIDISTSLLKWGKNPPGAIMLVLSHLWRSIFLNALRWIYEVLIPWISHAYHSLRDPDRWGSTIFSASLIQPIIAIMPALWVWILLALAALLVTWTIWRIFTQLIAGISARWTELCGIGIASCLWIRSLGSTSSRRQKPKQHSQRATTIKSELQSSSSPHSFTLKGLLLWILIGGVLLLISIFLILMYTSTKFNNWCWAYLNGRYSTW